MAVQFVLFYCLKEQLNHVGLLFSLDRKFEKSFETFDFSDFIIIIVVQPLFAFSAALMGS